MTYPRHNTAPGRTADAPAEPGRETRPAAPAGRDELAARQRGLVLALVAGGAPPAGVDEDRIRITATALVRKRSRSVARYQPELAAALGAGFWPAFLDYARARPGPPPHCRAEEAREFARYLASPAGKAHTAPDVQRAARAIAGLRRWRLPGFRPRAAR